ncbi:hypothetical protein BU17DRAFT_97965 [Hysterangium stoloniferum]|nr:hypothetical protein BU17DRAFT_97965 [Hysterangium stoloniferum]
MTSQQLPNPPRRSRKIEYTYSLTKQADGSYNLIAPSPPPHRPPQPIPITSLVPTTPKPTNPPPHNGPKNRIRMIPFYEPYRYVPRGPPANLYLYRQTAREAAASDKSLAQTIAAHNEYHRRVAVEQRTTQHGEPSRKSARVQAKTDITHTAIVHQLDIDKDDSRLHKKARTTCKVVETCKVVQASSAQDPLVGATTTATSPPPPIIKRPRKKPERKVNPRPTERLITRGLAKSVSASQSRSMSGDDVGKASIEVPEELTGQKRKRTDVTLIVKETESSSSTTPEDYQHPLPAASSVRGQSSSSDTLVDDSATASLVVKKELLTEETASTTVDSSEKLTTSVSPSIKAIPSSGNHPSGDGLPASTQSTTPAAVLQKIPRDRSPSKRSHSELDENEQDPAPRRSTRVVKRRKLE